MDQHRKVLEEPFTIKNNIYGFTKLKERIEKNKDNQEIRIGLESTGHYGNNLITFLSTNDQYIVYVVNPLLTSIARRSSSLRKTKTDKTDSIAICVFLIINFSTLKPYTLKSYHTMKLKSLSRFRLDLVKQQSLFKVEFSRLISLTFPELKGFTQKMNSQSNYVLFTEIGLPEDISRTRIDKLTNVLYKASHGHFSLDKAIQLKRLAKESIGTCGNFYKIQFQIVTNSIKHFNEQIKLIDKEIKLIMNIQYKYIMSIPGIKYTTGAAIVSEIGDISNFKSPDSLVAFAGLDPSVYQSGNFSSTRNKMSKRGSKYLRNAIWTSSSVIVHHDPVFSAFYSKKIKQGKHHNNAIGHVCKKLTRVIYSIMKSQNNFVSLN